MSAEENPPAAPNNEEEIPVSANAQILVANIIAKNKVVDYLETLDLVESSSLTILNLICVKFHAVALQMRVRRRDQGTARGTLEINDEYDVQDLLHSLLHIHFDDIRKEEPVPSHGAGGARIDLLLKKEKIGIEVKMTRENFGARELTDQLAIDIRRYREHPDCKSLLCFIYDPSESILNPTALQNDLSRNNGEMKVNVIVVPKR